MFGPSPAVAMSSVRWRPVRAEQSRERRRVHCAPMASGTEDFNGRPPARAGFAASSSVVAEHVDALVSSVGLFMADGNRSAVAIFSSLPTVAIAATCGTHIHTHSVASAFIQWRVHSTLFDIGRR